MSDANGSKSDDFPSTRWSLVLQAGTQDNDRRRAALQQLWQLYETPLRNFLIQGAKRYGRGVQVTQQDVEDFLQDFYLHQIQENALLSKADQERGRLRSFLRKCLQNYVRTVLRTEKRWRDMFQTTADEFLRDVADDRAWVLEPSAEEFFDLLWAQAILNQVLARFLDKCRGDPDLRIAKILFHRLLQPLQSGTPPPPYRQLAGQLGLDPQRDAADLMGTALRRLQRACREVVAETTQNPQEIDAEIDRLREILRQTGMVALRLVAVVDGSSPAEEPMPESVFFEAPSVQLAVLLEAHEQADWIWTAADLSAALSDELSRGISEYLRAGTALPPADQRSGTAARNQPPATLRDLLEHPHPPLDLLRAVKQAALLRLRARGSLGCDKPDSTVYLACLAAGVLHGGEKLPSSTANKIRASLSSLLAQPWLVSPLPELFTCALDRLAG